MQTTVHLSEHEIYDAIKEYIGRIVGRNFNDTKVSVSIKTEQPDRPSGSTTYYATVTF